MSSPATNLEPFYVVDTHALIWYLLNDKKLSSRAKAIFQAAEQNQTILIVSAIVMAELYLVVPQNSVEWQKGSSLARLLSPQQQSKRANEPRETILSQSSVCG